MLSYLGHGTDQARGEKLTLLMLEKEYKEYSAFLVNTLPADAPAPKVARA